MVAGRIMGGEEAEVPIDISFEAEDNQGLETVRSNILHVLQSERCTIVWTCIRMFEC